MTLDDVLHQLFRCLEIDDAHIVNWSQVQRWPLEAIEILEKNGWLKQYLPATTIECPGCENDCFMPIQYNPTPSGKASMAFVCCDVRRDMGKVTIPLYCLHQWQLTYIQLAQWFCNEINLRSKPKTGQGNSTIKLGSIKGENKITELHLNFNAPISLEAFGHKLPLDEIIYIDRSKLKLDLQAIYAMIELPPAAKNKIKAENKKVKPRKDNNIGDIGSSEWRENTARNAANTRHSKPGGSRDKQKQMHDIWATGKYTSRDLCAEQECAELDISFSAARKALRNTPDPT